MRNGGAAQKNKEAPQSFDSASRRRHLERSREISLAERSALHLRYFDHRLLLITSYSFLLSNFVVQGKMRNEGSGSAANIYFAAKLLLQP